MIDGRAVAACIALSGALLSAAIAGDAHASGVAYPAGSYSRLAAERCAIVWDEPSSVEHFIVKLTFDSDAKNFAFFFPTPVTPTIAPVDDAVLENVAGLAAGDSAGTKNGDPGDELRIDRAQFTSLHFATGEAFAEWLKQHGYVETRNLRYWAQHYIDKGWVLNAAQLSPPMTLGNANLAAGPDARGLPRSRLVTKAIRFSFKTPVGFFPYTEPVPDVKDEVDFVMKHRLDGTSEAPPRRGQHLDGTSEAPPRRGQHLDDAIGDHMPISIPKRPVDVWVISADPVHSTGNFFEGLPVQGTAHATGDRLAAALGDVSSWGFDPHGRADWAVTHLREELEQRVAFEDLTFEPQPPPAAPEPTVNPRVISGRLTKKGSGLRGREVFVLFGLVLFVAVAAIVGWSTEERSRRD